MFQSHREETSPEREERILRFWQEGKIFERSVEERKGCPLFSFYDGPPFATGLPHYGHLLAGTIKDVVPRYKTMKGFCVPRRFGWDCHGLPIENEIEKANSMKSVAPSSCAIRRSGKRQWIGWGDGSILAGPTARWTCRSWRAFGGSFSSSMKRDWSMKGLR